MYYSTEHAQHFKLTVRVLYTPTAETIVRQGMQATQILQKLILV